MVLVHGDHAGAGPADEGRVGEAESEIGSEVPDQSSALQREDPRADTPAMKAEDAREMESWVLCLCGHGRARRKKTSGVSFGGGGGGDGMLGEERARSLYKGATEAVWSMFSTLFRTSLDLKSRVV